jgi:hypothetical protein
VLSRSKFIRKHQPELLRSSKPERRGIPTRLQARVRVAAVAERPRAGFQAAGVARPLAARPPCALSSAGGRAVRPAGDSRQGTAGQGGQPRLLAALVGARSVLVGGNVRVFLFIRALSDEEVLDRLHLLRQHALGRRGTEIGWSRGELGKAPKSES